MRRLIAILVFFVAFSSFAADHADSSRRVLVIRDVTVIDMKSPRPRSGVSVVVTGNRITSLGAHVKVPSGAQVIDGRGKFLIPGLWDNYTFTLEAVKAGYPYFELLLAHGITGVRDSGTSMDLGDARRLREDITAGRIAGPRLFYAGRVLLGEMPPRRSSRWTDISTIVTNRAEVAAAVDSLAAAGVDYIKTEKRLSPELLRDVIARADRHGLPVVAVPPAYIADASNDGVDCIEHAAEIHRATSDKRDEYYALYRDRKIDSLTTVQNYEFFATMKTDRPYYERTLRTLARNGTCVATNTAQTNTFIGEFELSDESRQRFKSAEQLQQLERAAEENARQIREHDPRQSPENRARALADIRDLHSAGVMLLAGTQSSADATGTPGLMLHDELNVYVQAGLSPYEALKAATVNPARFMRRARELGTIEKGKLADLVLLDADPLADISNTRRIEAVIANGRYLSREALDEMLDRAEQRARALK